MTDTAQEVWLLDNSFDVDGKTSRPPMPESGRGDGSLEEESPWNRIGLSQAQSENQGFRRLLHGLFFVSAWLAMPMAVLTCHGWVGLLVHGLALSGAAGLLQKVTLQTRMGLRLHRMEGLDGDGVKG
jgi:hypothetical protein